MKISTKGRYALRMLLDLAEHQNCGYIALKDIAEIVAPVNRDSGLGEVLFRYVLEEDI